MSAIHGKQGYVIFNSEEASNVTSWTLDLTCDAVETTSMVSDPVSSATHWKSFEIGFKSWTAVVECNLEDTALDAGGIDLNNDFALDNAGLMLNLFTGMDAANQEEGFAAREYYGNAIITDISVSTDKDDVAKITYNFQGAGTLLASSSDRT